MADVKQDIPDDVNTITADDGTTWVEIASTGTADEATLLKGFLESEGIPAEIEDVKFDMEPVNFGAMGEIRVYVPGADEARAQQLLRSRESGYQQLDDDEETLITDDGPAVVDETAQVESDDGTDNT